MTTLNSSEQMKVLTHVEECLSSIEWGELADPLNDSTKILRALFHLSTLFPALKTLDNGLCQNAHRIFENNIRVISIIFQFHANSLSEEDASRVHQMAELLPKLETAANLSSCAALAELKRDSECSQNLTRHLRNITNVMNYISQILQIFKLSFFACSEDTFQSQEFASPSSELKEIVTMLEFKSVSAYQQTSGNSFLTVLFIALNRPFKIAMSALWLLFTFPAVENVKFDIILERCQCAVQIFVSAVNMMNNLTQLLLKDFDGLKVVREVLLKKFQRVSKYCEQILELTSNEASVLKKLANGETVDVLQDASCENVNISGETQNNSTLKSTVNLNDSQCNDVNMSDELQESSVIKSTNHSEDRPNLRGKNFDAVGTLKQAQKTSAIRPSVVMNNANSSSVVFSGKTQKTPTLKAIINAASVPLNFCNANLNAAIVSKEIQKTVTMKSAMVVKDTPCANVAICKDPQKRVTMKSPMVVKNTDCANAAIFKETQKMGAIESPMGVKDTLCANVAIFKETRQYSELNATANVGDTACNSASVLKESPRIVVLKSTENLIVSKSYCDFNFNTVVTSKETQKTSTLKSLVGLKNTNCLSTEILKKTQNMCVSKSAVNENYAPVHANFCNTNISIVDCAEKTPKTTVSKSTHRINNASSSFFDLWDFRTDKLTLKQRKALNNVIMSYKSHVHTLSFSVKIEKSELRIFCKICNQTSVAENIEKHLKNECQSQKRVKKTSDNQNAYAAISINQASSIPVILSGSGVRYPDIADVDLDSLAPKQREILQELIEKINLHMNHFSFGVRLVNSEVQAVECKLCAVGFMPENIEKHIKDLNHQRMVFRNCKKSQEIRATVRQIRPENWQFLQLAPGSSFCLCCLCAKEIALSVNAWIQHFHSSLHCEGLKKFLNLLGP